MADKYQDQRPKVAPPKIALADLRKSHRMTQEAVASEIAVITEQPFNGGSLSLIEGGHRGASAPVLRALEQVFRLAPGALEVDYEPTHPRRLGKVS